MQCTKCKIFSYQHSAAQSPSDTCRGLKCHDFYVTIFMSRFLCHDFNVTNSQIDHDRWRLSTLVGHRSRRLDPPGPTVDPLWTHCGPTMDPLWTHYICCISTHSEVKSVEIRHICRISTPPTSWGVEWRHWAFHKLFETFIDRRKHEYLFTLTRAENITAWCVDA